MIGYKDNKYIGIYTFIEEDLEILNVCLLPLYLFEFLFYI